MASYVEPPPAPGVGEGGIPILAVGHNGTGLDTAIEPGVAEVWRGEGARQRQWSERAMVWLIDHATTSIRISQQDLVAGLNGAPVGNPQVLRALGRAIQRGVHVFVSSPTPAHRTTRGNVAYWFVALGIRNGMSGPTEQRNPRLDEYLHLAPVAYRREGTTATAWPGGPPVANHAKFYMIDDRVFYIGSHNMYALPFGSALQEFGFIVESREAAARLLEVYWKPRWIASENHQVRPSSGIQGLTWEVRMTWPSGTRR